MHNSALLIARELHRGPQLMRHVDPLHRGHKEQQGVEERGEDAAYGDHDSQVASVARALRSICSALKPEAWGCDAVGYRAGEKRPEDGDSRRDHGYGADFLSGQAHREHV